MIPITILSQPDDATCGPTSLHAVYNYFGDNISLQQVIDEVTYLESGGTLEVFLACHALNRNYEATIYTYNINVFDPTWFQDEKIDIKEKLIEQRQYKVGKIPKLQEVTKGYVDFLNLGGQLLFADLNSMLLKKYFNKNLPILTGLSSTYLYQTERIYTNKDGRDVLDDIKGQPLGHFVILCGYDEDKKHVLISDPYAGNPFSPANYYPVSVSRLINSIMLGIMTYDANLLIIKPRKI